MLPCESSTEKIIHFSHEVDFQLARQDFLEEVLFILSGGEENKSIDIQTNMNLVSDKKRGSGGISDDARIYTWVVGRSFEAHLL